MEQFFKEPIERFTLGLNADLDLVIKQYLCHMRDKENFLNKSKYRYDISNIGGYVFKILWGIKIITVGTTYRIFVLRSLTIL